MQKLAITLLLYIAAIIGSHAATTGTWQLYQSFNNITEIVPAGNTCYALASGSLFSYSTTSGETAVYDKTNCLSDAGISHIAWSATAKRLIITYENSNIDLLTADGTVVNIPDLYMKSTTQDKTINHIFIDGQYAYLALGFGVMKVDIRRGYIADTYQLNFSVNYTYTKDGFLYAASQQQGIYRGKMADNLLDPNNWQRTAGYTAIKEDRLNVKDASTGMWWTRNTDGKLTYYTIDSDGNREYRTEGIKPDGPASNRFYQLYMHGGKLYSVAGFWSQVSDNENPGEVHVWDGTAWSEFEQPTQATIGHRYVDLLCMDFDPLNEGHVMVGAKGGIYEFQDGKFVADYGLANSPLESAINSKNYTIVGALKYDAEGNLWILNRLSDSPIKMLSKNKEWKTFAHNMSDDDMWDLTSLFISPTNGYMWFVNNYYNKSRIYAYDYKNDQLFTIGGPKYINEDATEITPEYLYSTSEDNDGNVWFATTAGPLYLEPANFQSGILTQHKVPRNDGTNLADYLLANIATRCIAYDGANRKWIGTSSGVFLISDDCNTQIEYFTTDNSPLPSNIIYSIAVDNNSNTVYFATDKGLCSYASDATQPSEEMTKGNVYAYPNPVTPEYTGSISIVGLTLNSDIKIVTSNGTLVNQGRSTGGSYHWDGCDLKGKRVASGIYMVEAATENGGKGTVCKIAIIN